MAVAAAALTAAALVAELLLEVGLGFDGLLLAFCPLPFVGPEPGPVVGGLARPAIAASPPLAGDAEGVELVAVDPCPPLAPGVAMLLGDLA
jgi:hypothetical protein